MEKNNTTMIQAACLCPNCNHEIPMSIISEMRSARMPAARTYTLLGTPETRKAKGLTMPPQARVCLAIMESCETEQISEEVLMKAIANQKDQLRTKQDPWRIFQYYRAQMNGAEIFKIS